MATEYLYYNSKGEYWYEDKSVPESISIHRDWEPFCIIQKDDLRYTKNFLTMEIGTPIFRVTTERGTFESRSPAVHRTYTPDSIRAIPTVQTWEEAVPLYKLGKEFLIRLKQIDWEDEIRDKLIELLEENPRTDKVLVFIPIKYSTRIK